jgi:soluble lytic murein transglycosylase-like protein
MAKPRDPSSLPDWWYDDLFGNGTTNPPPAAPRTPQGLLSYLEARNREANDNPPPSASRHAPILTPISTPTSLDEAHRAEDRWPVIDANDEDARRQSILENSPALFSIEENSAASGTAPIYRAPFVGQLLVRKYDHEIEEAAARAGVDPDLLRAIMFVEESQGNYGGLGWLADALGRSSSILPMNVKPKLWSGLLNDGVGYSRRYVEAGHDKGRVVDQGRNVLNDPRFNIRVGAILLKRIQERLADPGIRNVATLYNGLGKSTVSDYGAQVEKVYRDRSWKPVDNPIGRGPRPQ